MEWLLDPQTYIALLTLTALEIVLGIDNVIFISILAARVPPESRNKARRLGLFMAMGTRLALLFSLAWLSRLTAPLFVLFGMEFSGRDLILLGGGLFLLAKSTSEIHAKLEGHEEHPAVHTGRTMAAVVTQIGLLDVVFSLDSVITAVGMARQLPVMVTAIVLAVLVMLLAARPIGDFVERRPTVKILALSFLLLIGVSLVGEGLDFHIPKGYIYFAMGYSFFVEMLNLKLRGKEKPVALRQSLPR